MKQCTYEFTNKVGNLDTKYSSYEDLITAVKQAIVDGKIQVASDIVFSQSKKDLQLNKIDSQRVDAQLSKRGRLDTSELIDGNSSYEGRNTISLAQTINNPLLTVNGQPLYKQFSVSEYFKIVTDNLISQNFLEESQRQNHIDKITSNWNTIDADGYLVKYIISHMNMGDKTENIVANLLSDGEIKKNPRLHNQERLTQLVEQLKQKFINSVYVRNRSLRKGVNLSARVEKVAKEVLGHIDYLSIGEDGTLRIYLYKTSYEEPAKWPKEKKQHYRLQMAMLARILQANGLDITNISFHIIPIHLAYNDDFSDIQNIHVFNPMDITVDNNNKYVMGNWMDLTRNLVQKKAEKIEIPKTEVSTRADYILKTLFPNNNIRSEGAGKTVQQYIKEAPESGENAQLTIREEHTATYNYVVTLEGTEHPIQENNRPEKNKEIIALVTKYVESLDDYSGQSAHNLKDAIKEAYKQGDEAILKHKGLRFSIIFLSTTLKQYLRYTEDSQQNKVYDYELLEDLLDYNIIMFRNRKTKQVDVISLSSFDIDQKVSTKNGQNNILGFHKYDIEVPNQWLADYGNYEAVRAMTILNEVMPNYSTDDYKFGELKVLSSFNGGKRRTFNIKMANDQAFGEILNVAKIKGQDIKIQNNFTEEHFIDPIESLVSQYQEIIEHSSVYRKEELSKFGIDKLLELRSKEEKITALHDIIEQMRREYFRNATAQEINESSRPLGRIGTLFKLATYAYLYYTDAMPRVDQEMGSNLRRWMQTTTHIPQDNVQYAVSGYITAVNAAATELQKFATEQIIPIVQQYQKDCGYGKVENILVGDQLRIYKDLYEIDIDGKRMLKFKNPYANLGDNSYLSSHQREFLKRALYVFQLIRSQGNFNIQYGTKELENFANKNPEYYLQVPLIRAGSASKIQSRNMIKNAFATAKKVVKNPGQWFNEEIEHLSPEEAQQYEEDYSRMNLRNPFDVGEISIENDNLQRRKKYIEEHGVGYFETNVEDLMLFYASKSITTQKMNDFLTSMQAFLLHLEMMGSDGSHTKNVQDSYKYITDFLKVNVFKRPIEGQRETEIMAMLKPIRSLVRFMNLALNVKGSIRDLIQGGTEGFIRTVTKYNSDISAKSLSKAHAYVTTHIGGSNSSHTNLLSAMCTKYRLSNVDMAAVETRLRSGRAGICNINEFMYYTLKGPDFYNRMILFVAKLMEDGVWDAISFEDGKMVYDWKKDKRFSIYASGNTSHPDYAKQRGLYYSYIRMHNQEHPENKLEYSDDLKEPYTDKEILSIRGFADNIFGSYDKATKGMMEHIMIGSTFGQYTTWMNGIFNNYFARPGQYKTSFRELKQMKDDNGNLLFFREDGGITTEETDSPVVDSVPVPTQGIIYTIHNMAKVFVNSDNKLKDVIDYAKLGPNKANLKKLLSDAIMMIIYFALIRGLWGAQYKEKKKHMVDDSMVNNAIAEILYKSTESSFDSYLGPLAILDRWGTQANPPMYTVPIKNLTTLTRSIFDADINFGDWLVTNMAITRSFRDTYQAEKRKNKEQ